MLAQNSTGHREDSPALRQGTLMFVEWSSGAGEGVFVDPVEALQLQEIICTRDDAAQILHAGFGQLLAVFASPSSGLNRALEMQRVFGRLRQGTGAGIPFKVGLDSGELRWTEHQIPDVSTRQVQRVRRIAELAQLGQVLASGTVVEAGRDGVELSKDRLAIEFFGDFYLEGVGVASLCEVTDVHFRRPSRPLAGGGKGAEGAIIERLRLSGFEQAERVGSGPRGTVLRAKRGREDVAVKLLHAAVGEEAERRFRDLVAKAGSGTGSRFAQVEAKVQQSPPLLVTAWTEGSPITAALEKAAPNEVARVLAGACDELALVHDLGLAHGNLKPTNLVVRPDSRCAILDFGLAELVPMPVGWSLRGEATPEWRYAAPEQLRGENAGPSADVYALGTILFELLTGAPPFAGTGHDLIESHLHQDPPLLAMLRPDIPDGLQRICLKALEKDPAERYPTAREMGQDLQRWLRGEAVRTRPSAYENLLFHRVRRHVTEIQAWTARGLLNSEEQNRLLAAYEGLQRRGVPAVMEGRTFRVWQILVYLGGWSVVNGAMFWLIQYWDTLSRVGRLSLASLPIVAGLAWARMMWKWERFRLAFVALVLSVLAAPVFCAVWLNEFDIAASVHPESYARELLHSDPASSQLTNQQLLVTAGATLLLALAVMRRTGTITHSAQAVAALVLCYSSVLLWGGLKANLDESAWASLAAKYIPLLVGLTAGAQAFLNRTHRRFQAAPWIYGAAGLFLVITTTVAWHGPSEWWGMLADTERATAGLLLAMAGALQAGIGLFARAHLGHQCRWATFGLILGGLLNFLGGLGWAGGEGVWPAGWSAPVILGSPVPLPHLVFPVASFLVAVLASRYQMFLFLLVGLLGFGGSIHFLGATYFSTNAAWPRFITAFGTLCFLGALWMDLRRSRGQAADDLVLVRRL